MVILYGVSCRWITHFFPSLLIKRHKFFPLFCFIAFNCRRRTIKGRWTDWCRLDNHYLDNLVNPEKNLRAKRRIKISLDFSKHWLVLLSHFVWQRTSVDVYQQQRETFFHRNFFSYKKKEEIWRFAFKILTFKLWNKHLYVLRNVSVKVELSTVQWLADCVLVEE